VGHFDLVPVDVRKNLAFRRDLAIQCRKEPMLKGTLRRMCSDDILFFVGACLWTEDQRNLDSVIAPFIPWDYQQDAFLGIVEAIEASAAGRSDVRIPKSRDMGATWMVLTAYLWYWRFRRSLNFLVVSRTQEYVDKAGQPKTLFAKLDFMLRTMPGWLVPAFTRTELRLTNDDTDSAITGEATTGDVGRGGRFTSIMLDEFAAVDRAEGYRALSSTRDASRCRIFNSTIKGPGTAFDDVQKMKGMREIRLPWNLHPEKRKGLYIFPEGGELQRFDDYKFPDGYEFSIDGKLSSPWRDAEKLQCANSVEIAQEIDMDSVESSYVFFERSMIEGLILETARPFTVRGELKHDRDTGEPGEFVPGPEGRVRLWFSPTADGSPPSSTWYGIGCDVATGTGASNTAITVCAAASGERVADLVDSRIQPHEAGVYAVALARWFRGPDGDGARLVWERPGPGRNFGVAVQRSKYRHVWLEDAQNPDRTGWSPNDKDARRSLYYEYRAALNTRRFVNRSEEALRECLQIVNTPKGVVIHTKSGTEIDPTGARDNHGDRPTADALCWMLIQRGAVSIAPKRVVLHSSLAWRRAEVDRLSRMEDE